MKHEVDYTGMIQQDAITMEEKKFDTFSINGSIEVENTAVMCLSKGFSWCYSHFCATNYSWLRIVYERVYVRLILDKVFN